MSADPLAGQREAINLGAKDSLLWPDRGQGCPVNVGDVFPLRSCAIEITFTHRVQKGHDWKWRAEFKRIYPDQPLYLDRRGGYTTDERQAMRAPELREGLTIVALHSEQQQAPPPEPQAVPPHEVANYSASVEARERFEREKAEQAAAFAALPLAERVRRLEVGSPHLVGRQLARIKEGVEAAERKLQRAGKDPSGRAA